MPKRKRTPEEINKLRNKALKDMKKDFISGSFNDKKESNNNSFGKGSFGKGSFGKS